MAKDRKKTITGFTKKKENSSSSNLSVKDTDQIINQINPQKKTRITLDLEPEIYDSLKKFVKNEGRTISGYLKKLIRSDLQL